MIARPRPLVWLVLLALLGGAMPWRSASASDSVVVFNMTDTGYPPFMILAEGGAPPSGIVYDVLKTILERNGVRLQVTSAPKKRELEYFQLGKLDAHATAREWIADAGAFAFTDPILFIRNVLYSKATAPVSFDTLDDLVGMTAITHLGFVYPPLTRYFASGQIGREDTSNELSMLKMVLFDRGNFAILNDAVGAWLVRTQHLEGKFHVSRKAVTDFGYRIMFAKKWAPLVEAFNRDLAVMRDNGELAEIFARYGYVPSDPD